MHDISKDVKLELNAVYEEIMWLANRPGVTPSAARAWYTHIRVEKLKRRLRMFTGKVSVRASTQLTDLRLEHFLRIQTTLTQLIDKHIKNDVYSSSEFIEVICRCERVHIVTRDENYSAMRAKGDYELAGIELVEWSSLNIEIRAKLWPKMLRGKVANASDFTYT